MSQWEQGSSYSGRLAVTESGWMTAEAFHEWLLWFSKEVTARPLLLVMDGHSSHLSYKSIEHVSC